jgi:hypothetical protein
MYYIGLDVYRKTISYCIKDAIGQVHQEGKIGATRHETGQLDGNSSATIDSGQGCNDFHQLEAIVRVTLTTGKTDLQELLEA